MHSGLLALHSYLRWAVLLFLGVSAARALAGWTRRRPYTAADRRLGLFAMISLDLQLVIGLALYFGTSTITHAAWAHLGVAMKQVEMRFWAVEHISLMLLAAFVIHLGRVLARRAADDRARQARMAFATLVGLALILMAIPWPFRGGGIGRPWLPHW